MITMTQFGNHGRAANQFFQYASLYSLAKKYGVDLQLPQWKYAQYFTSQFPAYTTVPTINEYIEEQAFHYTPDYYDSLADKFKTRGCNFKHYLQSEKYFSSKEDIKNLFTFKPEFIQSVKDKIKITDWNKKNIALQIRRTDYVHNSVYYQLPIAFYLSALLEHFPDYEQCNIILVSDDMNYCHNHFGCLPNAYFIDGFTDIEQICLMSQCDGFIISNGTFGWWGAWLAEQQREVRIIHSGELFDGEWKKKNNITDFYPETWIKHDPTKKVNLKNTTFTIPVFFDHNDRQQNLNLSVCLIQKTFDTNMIVGEQAERDKQRFIYMNAYSKYVQYEYKEFHRTKMLNEMAKEAQTDCVVNWDCDIIIPPLQVYLACKACENGTPMCYPYDGTFIRLSRHHWFKRLEKDLDIGIAYENPNDATVKSYGSAGGAVMVNRAAFIEAGMENERMISYGPEDWERNDRFRILELKIERITGKLYHVDHFVGVNSSSRNPHFEANNKEHEKIKHMNKEQLTEYVKTFEWVNK